MLFHLTPYPSVVIWQNVNVISNVLRHGTDSMHELLQNVALLAVLNEL